jgi:hypothetical protein
MPATYKTLNALQQDFKNLLHLQVQFFLIVIIISLGCNSGKSAYRNESERNYMNRSSATIWHDKKAIKHQSKNGVYTVSFNYGSGAGICTWDTSIVITKAITAAKKAMKMMNHKENYSYVDIIYNSNDERNDSIVSRDKVRSLWNYSCHYQIRMSLDSIHKAKIIRSYNDFSGVLPTRRYSN